MLLDEHSRLIIAFQVNKSTILKFIEHFFVVFGYFEWHVEGLIKLNYGKVDQRFVSY